MFKRLIYLVILLSVPSAQGSRLDAFSGVGITAGLGGASTVTHSEYGAFSGQMFTHGGYTNGIRLGNPELCVNFTFPALQMKNKSGTAYIVGIWAQHTSSSKMTVGVRWLWGRSGASSICNYSTGFLQEETTYRGDDVGSITIRLSENGIQKFRLKDSWFTGGILDGGYVFGPIQLRLGLGAALHRQKLYCINTYGKSSGALFKTVTAPLISIGGLWWATRRISVGCEYQCHWLGKKSWSQVAQIIPESTLAYGTPTLKMRNNIFLINLNYLFEVR
ncbi:hypothetical protein [Holospora curviuscula]|uniref:Outer membrane protein beta-barrel domain-containing protein n=1 Tax=Holospora curviuscula TaxID=1082868 RepID=A0A2S5RA67_9PROT|nr:hypothetical protein [Holospora curviuscula]PPE04224.1 hypothetical protein HCUR_00415 [Holospora curviuscula]